MGEPMKVSIIVPVYNVEAYLDRCLSSVVKQTYRDLDIIVVDDGSTDACPGKCDEWAGHDERVRVVHKKNGGLSSARNAGLDTMTGELVAFVDSDDWIEPDMIERMVRWKNEHHADIVQCGVLKTFEDGRAKSMEGDRAARTFTGDEALHAFLYHRDRMTSAVWNKLYDARLFRDGDGRLRFPSGLNSEDYYMMCRLYGRIGTLYYEPQPFYHYCVRKDSICRSGINPHSFDKIAIADDCRDYLRSCGYPDQQALDYFVMQGHYDVLYTLLRNHADARLIGRYRRELAVAAKPVYGNASVGLSKKARILLISHMPRLYYRLTAR
ncbi:glycosyltransferase family 2 protein [Bifidobacterium merycicum]|uniref:Family 2 glycosyl transferase n=1 Tax=Bifidobacterium merycicum TaxID=78345 RepID=A0A087BF40_9BIFI|nr:glycosyltransferase family 2 protein [Bifidobacterium merycicum]KFI69640.1 family 2 glycosyl transferase [Bifidobacterium merycicum]SHE78157.1 Glycosyltransferase involved in cell wall bisynthesis [Bifidobacterium merycicum DSM 6492]